ncbi:unnamed protein product [Cyclocybe aegerita]|uniref:ATP synthase mitochondrial F1 complex assembly factor 1 n=1 Tax=Cyclocybe aegerita TaxID=1973307 RepID=A0A8S0WVS0_CYCAE|nr:unnamed protein product [Cyclocybe aegerita]
MNTQPLSTSLRFTSRLLSRKCLIRPSHILRAIASQAPEHQAKYADKLRQKAEEAGLSVSELVKKAEAEKAERRKAEADKLKAAAAKFKNEKLTESPSHSSQGEKAPSVLTGERKDATPFRALSSILSLPRLLSTPHTPEQISALWTAYHASRSGGTGRGFVCATIPLKMYKTMENSGRAYPSFVVPVPRVQQHEQEEDRKGVVGADESDPALQKPKSDDNQNVAHEFYYLQWDFHDAPPIPTPSEDLFAKPVQTPEGGNPPTATILFTPLQEYKMRGSFATPYLVLTLYADLSATHGLVLLRGEITPSTGAGNGTADRYMLTQEDSQLLTMALQKFYLWNEDPKQDNDLSGKTLLRTFHERPQEFKWEDLIKFSNLTI